MSNKREPNIFEIKLYFLLSKNNLFNFFVKVKPKSKTHFPFSKFDLFNLLSF